MALPAGLTRRGRIYYSKFKDPKTSAWRRQSVGPDLVLALQRHAELRGRSEETEPGRSFKELAEPWLQAQETRCKPRTVQVSRQRIRGLLTQFGDLSVPEITPQAIDRFVRERRRQGVKDISINGDLTALRQIVRYAEETGLIGQAPRVKLLRVVKKTRRRTLASSDVARLLRAADEWPGDPRVSLKLKAFILIAATTGLRIDEVLHLRWEDVDFNDRRFDVRAKTWNERRLESLNHRRKERLCSWSPKSHQERSVWAHGVVLFNFLEDYRNRQARNGPKDWVFQGKRAGLRLTTIFKALRETFKWAGLYEKGKLAHTLRHSVATELLANGVDLETVRDVLGHQNVTTTALYLHAVDERKRQAATRVKLV